MAHGQVARLLRRGCGRMGYAADDLTAVWAAGLLARVAEAASGEPWPPAAWWARLREIARRPVADYEDIAGLRWWAHSDYGRRACAMVARRLQQQGRLRW